MSVLVTVVTTAMEPVVSVSTGVLWLAAAATAVAAQTDSPTGPAPRARSGAARRALVLTRLGVAIAAVQAVGAAGAWLGWLTAPAAAATWPALVGAVTGGALVLAFACRPLRRLAAGRALTDRRDLHRLHAALRAAVVAGALAAFAAVVGSGLAAADGSVGPYLAPTAAVVALVLAAHAALRRGMLAR